MLTTFFFVFLAVVLFYILANLVFVGLSKAYLERQKIIQKQKENEEQGEEVGREEGEEEEKLGEG